MGVVSCSGDLIRYGFLVYYDQFSTLTLNIFLSTYKYQDVFRQAETKTLVSHFFNITFN